MKYIQVLAYGPGFGAEPTFIADDLETFQEIVGGQVEIFDYEHEGVTYQIVVNEDAEPIGLRRNRKLGDRTIFGKFLVTRCTQDPHGNFKFKTLPVKQLEKIWKHIDATNSAVEPA